MAENAALLFFCLQQLTYSCLCAHDEKRSDAHTFNCHILPKKKERKGSTSAEGGGSEKNRQGFFCRRFLAKIGLLLAGADISSLPNYTCVILCFMYKEWLIKNMPSSLLILEWHGARKCTPGFFLFYENIPSLLFSTLGHLLVGNEAEILFQRDERTHRHAQKNNFFISRIAKI